MEFVKDHLLDLYKISLKQNETMLAYLLEMAIAEADAVILRNGKAPKPHPWRRKRQLDP